MAILSLAVISATAVVRIRTINDAVEQIMNGRYQKVRMAREVKEALDQQFNHLKALVIDAEHPGGGSMRKTRDAIARIDADQFTEIGGKLANTVAPGDLSLKCYDTVTCAVRGRLGRNGSLAPWSPGMPGYLPSGRP